MSSFNIIGSLVLENKNSTLYWRGGRLCQVTWTIYKKKCVPPSHEGSTLNLASSGQAVSNKKIFENGGRRMDGRQSMGMGMGILRRHR